MAGRKKIVDVEPQLDEWDHENLTKFLKLYEKVYPPGTVRVSSDDKQIEYQNIQEHLNYMRERVDPVIKKSEKEQTVLRVSVPPTFRVMLSKGYPKLLSDRQQTDQFLEWFPQFDLTKGTND